MTAFRMAFQFGLVAALALVAAPLSAYHASAGEPAQSPYADVPVPTAMIYAGQPVRVATFIMRRIASRYVASASLVVDLEQLEGKIARSTLVPGRPVSVNQLREPDVINASKPVRIIYRSGTLVITGEVIPLTSASVGEIVRARNVATGLVVSGIAQADGTLLVSGR